MKCTFPRYAWALLFALVSSLLAGCDGRSGSSDSQRLGAEVARTSFGVVHVRASDFKGLGYGLGYAYARDNVCMFADSLLTVRGERSRFFGPDAMATRSLNGEYGADLDFIELKNEDSDFFFKAYLDIDKLREGYAAGRAETREVLSGYAAGYNRYLKDHASKLPAACSKGTWVRPISVDDLYLVIAEKALHASGEVFAREIVDAARDTGAAPAPSAQLSSAKPDPAFFKAKLARLASAGLGSNGLALGRDITASGRGILLGNPHYPWTSTDRFFQVHLTVPGRYDAMGVSLGGLPIVVIGFNKDVAWTHTVTTAVHFTTFRLALDPADSSATTYLYDGVPEKLLAKTVSVDSLHADGRITTRSKTFYFSRHGALMVKPDAGLAWTRSSAYALADPNRNNTRMLDQWLGIGTARSVADIKASLATVVGLPWINIVAADRDGQAYYADASLVPHFTTDRFASACFVMPAMLMFDGAKGTCAPGRDARTPDGIFSPASGPSLQRTDYVGNSNDSYWLSHPRHLLLGPAPLGYSPLYGRIEVEQSLRTRIGFLQMEQAIARNRRFRPDDAQELAFANRIHAAELVLPDLLRVCAGSGDAVLASACAALDAWDRRADLDSRGAVLFREFWNAAARIPGKWAVPFARHDPVNTPRGLAPEASAGMLAALKVAALRLQTLGIPFDGRLGDFQGETRNGVRVPIHGGIGDIDGSYNSIHMSGELTPTGYNDVGWGTSYVQVVTFDEVGPLARAILVYGQSTDPKSTHYADQLPLYALKRWVDLPFSTDAIKADPNHASLKLAE